MEHNFINYQVVAVATSDVFVNCLPALRTESSVLQHNQISKSSEANFQRIIYNVTTVNILVGYRMAVCLKNKSFHLY